MAGRTAGGDGYAELHCVSNFSFLQAGSHPEELVARAAQLGYAAIAITDRASLSGIVRAHAAAKEAGIKLIVGAEVEPVDAAPLVLWAADRTGYANLCRLLTAGLMKQEPLPERPDKRLDGPDEWDEQRAVWPAGEDAGCRLTADEVAAHAEGLLAGLPLARLPAPPAAAVAAIRDWQDRLGDRLYGLAEVAREGDDCERLESFALLGRRTGLPLVAAGDVRYHDHCRQPLHDALAAVRHGGTVEAVRDRLLANGERHLQERWRIGERFASLPGATAGTLEVADRCQFSLEELRYEYPDANVPAGRTPADYLAELSWTGAQKRYPDGIPQKWPTCSVMNSPSSPNWAMRPTS